MERFKNANLPPVQCVSGLEQEAAGLETEESLAGFNIREANHTIFKRCGVFQAGEPNPELENVKSFTRTNINKPDFTPEKSA